MSDQIAAPETAPSSVLNRAWAQIARTVKEIGPRRRDNEINLKADLPETDEERLLAAFKECVDSRGGAGAARARAAAALPLREGRGRALASQGEAGGTQGAEVGGGLRWQ